MISIFGTNLLGDATNDMVSIVREGTGTPVIDLLGSDGTFILSSAPTLGGTNNFNVVGTIFWTNSLSGDNGSFAATSSWNIAGITWNIGLNPVTVIGTNLVERLEKDGHQILNLDVAPPFDDAHRSYWQQAGK